jgi:nucleoside-diphosphate-sugar epimerase
MPLPTILITGANGQLGTVLQAALRDRYGEERVIASDIRRGETITGRFAHLDATDAAALTELVRREEVTQVYHLAAILSATGEQDPLRSWDVNMRSLLNVLEVSRLEGVERVFYPSTIAVFGPGAPLDETPNDSYLDPLTVYGISKATGENWAQYYHHRYGLDVRSLRYPGVIGYQSLPGGGTTDYAVDIFHRAVRGEAFTCFLEADERLPMIYMDDAIRATLELMDAPANRINLRTSYNIAGCSFSPAELTAAIRRHLPELRVDYRPDFRQAIAARWPNSLDDSAARRDWGWKPTYDLGRLVREMIDHLGRYYRQQSAISTPK